MSDVEAKDGAPARPRAKTREGVVVSNKMEKTVTVSIERQTRHELYGKTQRRTSKFLAHNENAEIKVGDRVAIVEARPMSRRKRWVVTRVVEKAKQI